MTWIRYTMTFYSVVVYACLCTCSVQWKCVVEGITYILFGHRFSVQLSKHFPDNLMSCTWILDMSSGDLLI